MKYKKNQGENVIIFGCGWSGISNFGMFFKFNYTNKIY